MNKITPVDSPNKGAHAVTRRSSHVRTHPKEIPKSVECSRLSPKLPGRDEAATITPPEAGPSSEVVAGAASSTLQPFQTQFIRNIVMDAMEEFRDQIRQDVLNLHTELIKQFFIQQV